MITRHVPPPTIELLEGRIAPAFSAVVDLTTLNGTDGFELTGAVGGRDGYCILSEAGDFNGDGVADFLVGNIDGQRFGIYTGRVFVVFGRDNGFPAAVNLQQLDGTNGFELYTSETLNLGMGSLSLVGTSVSGAGDLNDDGFNDLIVSSPMFRDTSYIIYGKTGAFPARIDCAQLNVNDGFAIVDDAVGRFSTRTLEVSSIGDFNADGIDDVLVGGETGAYVVLGRSSNFPARVLRSTLDGTNGFELKNSGLTQSLSGAGDVNGDGFSDLIVSGATTCVVFGREGPFLVGIDVAALNGPNGFTLTGASSGDGFGRSVSGAGDVNGDGFADLIVGAPDADINGIDSGASYLIFGRGAPFPAQLAVTQLDGTNGFRMAGLAGADHAGRSVGSAGDLNGDGYDDIVTGAPDAHALRAMSGEIYVVFGRTNGFTADVSLAQLNGSNGFRAIGAVREFAGSSVSGAGDVNGDGLADLIVSYRLQSEMGGPFFYSPGGYVVLGNSTLPNVNVADTSVAESDSGTALATFTVRLSEVSTNVVTVQYLTADGTAQAPLDYFALNLATLTFAPGETSKTINIQIRGDQVFERDESFFLNLSNSTNANIDDPQARATITNDDPLPAINVADVAVIEGANGNVPASFVISLSSQSSEAVSVQYMTSNGTATAPEDYTALASSTLTFAPFETSKTVVVDIVSDGVVEADEEFFLDLSNPIGATLADSRGEAVIFSDELPPTVSIDDRTAIEGIRGKTDVTFTISLSRPSSDIVSVHYATADSTASSSDYDAVPTGVLTFNPGERSKTVVVEVIGDTDPEADENFFLNLSAPVNATLARPQGEGTILNDDVAVMISTKGTKARFIDTDGDAVTVKTSRGRFVPENFVFNTDGSLVQLDLTAPETLVSFSGAKLSISSKTPRSSSGDGLISLPVLDAMGTNLKSVKIDGPLGQIDAGEGIAGATALKKLKVQTLGAVPVGGEESTIAGTLGTLKTKGDFSGVLEVTGGAPDAAANIAGIALKKAIIGGNIDGSGGGARAGLIDVAGGIGKVVVKGSIIGGAALSGIVAGGNIGRISIAGDLTGSDSTAPVTISALGSTGAATFTEAVALDVLKIDGNVLHAEVLAGYARDLTPLNPLASIHTINVGGNWTASSAVAGIADVTGDGFGRNDAPISGAPPFGFVSRIASVTVRGEVAGSGTDGDFFGLTAQQIGRVITRNIRPHFTPGPDDFLLDPVNNDFRAVDFT